jgi:hypothetical protein
MDKLQELIEWMEGEELSLDQNLADWAIERAIAIEHCITKAKQLQAEQDEHKNRLSKKIEL